MVTGSPHEPPSAPVAAQSLDDLSAALNELREWAGSPSYTEIARQVQALRSRRGISSGSPAPGRVTIWDCFRPGRSRVDIELICDIVAALGAPKQVPLWRQAHAVLEGQAAAASVVVVDRSIALPVGHFVGRERELTAALKQPHPVAIVGMPGVGKTQLARELARRLRSQVPAGQPPRLELSANLRGYDEQLPPADPAAVLGELLRAFQVEARRIRGLDHAARVNLLARLCQERRPVVLLDDAHSPEQISPLLGALRGARVVVTCRRSLRNLGAEHQLVSVELDVLDTGTAVELMRKLAPNAPIEQDPGTAAEIAELCGRLPLYLALTGARMEETPTWSLADQRDRLASLQMAEEVRPALASSYRNLTSEEARLLRALPLHPAEWFDVGSAAAIAGVSPAEAEVLLARLVQEHLVVAGSNRRFGLHGVVSAFAGQLARETDPYSGRVMAVERLLVYYTVALRRAVATLGLRVITQLPTRLVDVEAAGVPEFRNAAEALAWAAEESANAVNLVLLANSNYDDLLDPDVPAGLVAMLFPLMHMEGRLGEIEILDQIALGAEDPHLKAVGRINLGHVQRELGRSEAAADLLEAALNEGPPETAPAVYVQKAHLRWSQGSVKGCQELLDKAVELSRVQGDTPRLAHHLCDRGALYGYNGHLAEAMADFDEALGYCKLIGARESEMRIHILKADQMLHSGEFDGAQEHLHEALEGVRTLGVRSSLTRILYHLGQVAHALGQHQEAEDWLVEALEVAVELSREVDECENRAKYGEMLVTWDRLEEAELQLRSALTLAEASNSGWVVLDVHNGFGELNLRRGDLAAAAAAYDVALPLAEQYEDAYEIGRTALGLGRVAVAAGDVEEARRHWESALASWQSIKGHRVGEVEALLATLPD